MTDNRRKTLGQFRLQLNGVLKPFMKYDTNGNVPHAMELITKLAEQAIEREADGKDIPIMVDMSRILEF